jgi:hypothetical protein
VKSHYLRHWLLMSHSVYHSTELNGAMTALKAAIADKERTKACGNYVNADQEKRQAYDSKVTNAENIINKCCHRAVQFSCSMLNVIRIRYTLCIVNLCF